MKSKRHILSDKDTSHPKSLHALGLLYVTLNLGTFVQIGPLNISWLVSLYLAIVYLTEDGMFYFKSKTIRNIFIGFILWIVYALVFALFIRDTAIFITFYLILLSNAFVVMFSLLIIRTNYELKYALRALSMGIAINILAAGWEYFTGSIIIQSVKYRGLPVVAGFIGNYNDFCTFMFIGIVLYAIEILLSKKMVIKSIYAFGIVVEVLIIFYNGARGAIFSLYILVALLLLLYFLRMCIKSKLLFYTIVFFFAALVVISIWRYINEVGIYKALALLDRSAGGDTGSDLWRYHAIIKCLNAFKDSFGFGVGSGQTISILNGNNVHNFYIEIITEYGIIFGFFTVYLSLIVFISHDKNIPPLMDALIQACGYSMIIANVTSSSSNKMRALWIFMTLIFLIKKTDLLHFKIAKEHPVHEKQNYFPAKLSLPLLHRRKRNVDKQCVQQTD
jgi:hypothetical protein